VRRHRDQIHLLSLRRRRDFLGWITRRQHGVNFDPRLPQVLRHPLQVRPVLLHFL